MPEWRDRYDRVVTSYSRAGNALTEILGRTMTQWFKSPQASADKHICVPSMNFPLILLFRGVRVAINPSLVKKKHK